MTQMESMADAITAGARWLAGVADMSKEFGTSFRAVTMPSDMLRPPGSVVVSMDVVAGVSIGIAIIMAVVALHYWARYNRRENEILRNEAVEARGKAETERHHIAKLEKQLNRMVMSPSTGDALALLPRWLTEGNETLGKAEGFRRPTEDPPKGSEDQSLASALSGGLQDTRKPSEPLKQATEDYSSAQSSDPSGSSETLRKPFGTEDLPKTQTEDPLKTWASENLSRPGPGLQAKPLYEVYVVWCEARSLTPVTIAVFGKAMPILGYEKGRDSKTGHVVYQNIGLKRHNLKVVK